MMTTLENENPVLNVLLIEDNPGDVVLTNKAFDMSEVDNNVMVANNGELALKMLKKEEVFRDLPKPDVILLDLNLPKKSGQEVLADIKNDENLKNIPVIILTSSKEESDIAETFDLKANGYMIKPVNSARVAKMVVMPRSA